jgi:AAA+ superfamily predicted ATPase
VDPGLLTEYDLQLHRAHLRAMRAVVRRDPSAGAEVLRRLDAELTALDHDLAALPSDDATRPMLGLARALGLDDDQVDFLWTAVALAANPPMRVHAAELDPLAAHGLTTALYCRMVELPADRSRRLGLAIVGDHPAVQHGLLRVGHVDRVPTAWTLAPAVELVCHLAGLPRTDPDCVVLPRPPQPLLDPRQDRAVAKIGETLASDLPLALFVEGPELTGRRTAIALASSRPALAIDLRHVTTAPALATRLMSLRRESLLRGAVPVVAGVDDLGSGEGGRDERTRVLAQFVDAARAPVVLVSARPGVDLGARLPSVRIEWPVPDVATRLRLWSTLVGGGEPADRLQQLATRFPLGAGAIQRAVDSARLLAGGDAPLTPAELMAGVRQNIAERLGSLAERIAVKQTWEDLVLADDVLMQVRALVSRVRHSHVVYEEWGYRSKMPRGVGVPALFSGPPGTGKTMVAGLIAEELDLDLYQIDLSKVVSKWVGETEKQLASVFDAAEAGHALLLFDEADALFGQRTSEMKGANDRYANLEVNFLLQRIERFGGVVILTTNLDTSIDKALKRRLAAHVVFPHPDDDERSLLWRRLLTAERAPLADDIDVAKLSLAYPKMTGANIRNAVLGAAFLAAAEGRRQIDQEILLYAARGEYLAMGQVLSAQLPRPGR